MEFLHYFLFFVLQFTFVLRCSTNPGSGVQLEIQEKHVVMDNGIVQVTIANPEGVVTGIQYNGIDNLLEVLNTEFDRGYWDMVWDQGGNKGTKKGAKGKGKFDRIEATNFKVIEESEEQVELSFTRMWNFSLEGKLPPLNIDTRFIMLRGSSGFYTYAIYDHLKEWPAFDIDNTRVAFKLRKDKFHYMAMADNRQRFMPLPDDRLPRRGKVLDYPEAVRLVNPVEPEFKGEVDDKYQYASESRNDHVHGWISIDYPSQSTGFWLITPSYEFRSGGPLKQYLTSHVGPTSLSVFHSIHYSGTDLIMKFGANEPWKKVFGPIFIYLNSFSDGLSPTKLWEDAKQQMVNEVESWPYTFPASEDFLSSNQRGKVEGRLFVRDRYINNAFIPASGAYVGLASPGAVGSWQREHKGYQFWTTTDEKGYFSIIDIRPGNYNLYSWVTGYISDYQYNPVINVTSGCQINVGVLVYKPPRYGPTLWEIGIPDRSAAEFYVPDPNPKYINRLYLNHPDRFRQYGLWERYTDLYPNEDLIYTVGVSDYRKDWFFAQVTRKKGNNTYEGTTWQIHFNLDYVNTKRTYKLRVALASAHYAELQVPSYLEFCKYQLQSFKKCVKELKDRVDSADDEDDDDEEVDDEDEEDKDEERDDEEDNDEENDNDEEVDDDDDDDEDEDEDEDSGDEPEESIDDEPEVRREKRTKMRNDGNIPNVNSSSPNMPHANEEDKQHTNKNAGEHRAPDTIGVKEKKTVDNTIPSFALLTPTPPTQTPPDIRAEPVRQTARQGDNNEDKDEGRNKGKRGGKQMEATRHASVTMKVYERHKKKGKPMKITYIC